MFRWFHHIGTFLLFAATVFLIIPSITSPVINSLGLLTVDLRDSAPGSGSEVSFGSWGYCIQDGNGKYVFSLHPRPRQHWNSDG
jgi:hypothetical protein